MLVIVVLVLHERLILRLIFSRTLKYGERSRPIKAFGPFSSSSESQVTKSLGVAQYWAWSWRLSTLFNTSIAFPVLSLLVTSFSFLSQRLSKFISNN